MENFADFLSAVEGFMGFILIFLLFGTGIFFTVKLNFIQFRKFNIAFKKTFGGIFKKKPGNDNGALSSFQALATAVAAQIGTGNVAGVAGAISVGGPGAVFWMWISAILGMATIFAESILSQHYRERIDGELVGGPAYYISKGIGGRVGKILAIAFSILIIIALGFIGNAVQSNSISAVISRAFSIPNWVIGIIIAFVAALIFIGGISRIGRFAETVVPLMAILYVFCAIVVMVKFSSEIIPAFKLIFSSAFTGNAAMGGIVGASIKSAVKMGVKRGLFSNEAGMGSTPHAHAVANVKHPVEQGYAAMIGVFVDTILVCSATAIIILTTKAYMIPNPQSPTGFFQAAELTQQGFEIAFPGAGSHMLAVCLTFFAFTTVIGWYYFGESNIRYLFGKSGILPYQIAVCAFIFAGSIQKVDVVWTLSDVANEFMVIPNLIALIYLSGLVKKVVDDYDGKVGKENIEYDYPVK